MVHCLYFTTAQGSVHSSAHACAAPVNGAENVNIGIAWGATVPRVVIMYRAYELQGYQLLSLRVGSNIIQIPKWVELNIGHFLHFNLVFLFKQFTLFKTPSPKISHFPLFIFRPKSDKSIGLGARLQVFYIV